MIEGGLRIDYPVGIAIYMCRPFYFIKKTKKSNKCDSEAALYKERE